jgi:hypothetical protein
MYYYKRANKNHSTTWVCHVKTCNASVCISENGNEILNVNGKKFLNKEQILDTHLQSAMNSFKYHFPQIQLSGCLFHLGQNVYRHCVDVGLRAAYAKDDALKLWIRKFISLALVPKNIVELTFHLTNLECPASYEPTQVARFSDYVLKYYVGDSDTGTQALFPVSLWNHFDNDGPRTNNSVEGYNFRMGKYLETHSNIWTFITKLKKEESSAALKYFRILNGT